MKKFMAFLFFVLFVGGAFAAGENVPTGKSYVDSKLGEKQDIIPANDGAARVLTNTGMAGEYGTRGIYDANGDYATQQNNLVDAASMNAAVQNAIDSEFECVDNDCILFNVVGGNVAKSPNLFDISKVKQVSLGGTIINNGNGCITVSATSSNAAISSRKSLSTLAPEIVANKIYTLSFDTTGNKKYIYLSCIGHTSDNTIWDINTSKLITENLLDCNVNFYASGVSTTATIKNIQITEGTDVKPYVAYGNIYMPVGQ